MRAISFALICTALFLLSACKTYFTDPIRKSVQEKSITDIEKVQFYNDREIELVFRTAKANDTIEAGKVVFEHGFYNYYITIPKNTKAQAKQLDEERLRVYFESGEDRYLIFGDSKRNQDEYYQLYGRKQDTTFLVRFEGKEFEVTKGSKARLKIKKSDKNISKSERRKVKGVEVK